MGWQYERTESEGFAQVPVGKHRVRIKEVTAEKSKSGNDMLKIILEVSGTNLLLFHYITFLNDRPEITNRMLTNFFDSFKDIQEGNFKFTQWAGKVGACMVSPDKNDADKTRLSYFIAADKQDELPPWQEPSNSGGGVPDGFEEVTPSDDDLPF